MNLRPTIALLCAIVLLPFSSAAAQLRLTGTGLLAAPISPFESFSAGAVQFEFLIPQPSAGVPLEPAAILLEGLGGRFVQGITQLTLVGDLLFYTGDFDGGFSFESPVGTFILDTFGEQMFAGTIQNAFLIEGEYALENFPDFPALLELQGSVALTAVPEPSSLLLMLAGGSLLAVVAKRRRN
jgi:PEP-CTERM motif